VKIIFCEEELNEIKNLIKEYGDKIMAGVLDIKNAQATEKADLATLVALIPQLLTAMANGTLSPADAQNILDEINAEDATVKSSVTTITAALAPPATS
jgi:hypothetical protein